MIKNSKHIFIKMAVFLLGCFFISACENDVKEVRDLGRKRIAVEEGTDIVSYFSEGGVLKAKLTAPLLLRTQQDTQKTEFPNTLHVDFYNDSTKIESELFAKYGRYLENQNKVFLKDSVIVFNIKGDTLRSDELYWDQNKQIFYTDKSVQIHTPTEKLTGTGFTADQAFTWYTLKNATGPMTIADSSLPAD